MLARLPRERRTGEGGEKPRKDATAPRAHRGSYDHGGSIHWTITSRAVDISGEPPLAEGETVEGRGGGVDSEPGVWITGSLRHSSSQPE